MPTVMVNKPRGPDGMMMVARYLEVVIRINLRIYATLRFKLSLLKDESNDRNDKLVNPRAGYPFNSSLPPSPKPRGFDLTTTTTTHYRAIFHVNCYRLCRSLPLCIQLQFLQLPPYFIRHGDLCNPEGLWRMNSKIRLS